MVTILGNRTPGRQNFTHKTYVYIHERVVFEEAPEGSSFLQGKRTVLEFLKELEWHPLYLHPFTSQFCLHVSYHCSVLIQVFHRTHSYLIHHGTFKLVFQMRRKSS
jgi:hypothetical protein